MDPDKTVIIVDDEEEICLLLQRFLSRRYGSVLIFHTLMEGLKAAETAKNFDYLFLDNNLPDGIGIDKIAEFKKYCKKIIVISAMTNLESKALSSGADFFIGKPVSFTAIEKSLA